MEMTENVNMIALPVNLEVTVARYKPWWELRLTLEGWRRLDTIAGLILIFAPFVIFWLETR